MYLTNCIQLSKKRIYIGHLKDGTPHGFGMIISERYTFEGHFVNGKKNGLGIIRSKNKRMFGEYYQGKKHGMFHEITSKRRIVRMFNNNKFVYKVKTRI